MNKPLSTYRNVYLLGIGGIGMSALARYFHLQGCRVAGYDRSSSAITTALQQSGMEVHFDGSLSNAPEFLWKEAGDTLVIYTPAIPLSHPVLDHLIRHNYPVKKRSTILGDLSREFFTIAVGGAHGKTSTSALIAHALKVAEVPFFGFLGGICTNYQTNFLAPDNGQEARLMLTEADEYDRSFLKLAPDVAILTSTDADHLDIYETPEALYEAYQQFTGQTKEGGNIICPVDFKLPTLPHNVTVRTFGIGEGDWQASRAEVKNRHYHFQLSANGTNYAMASPVPGRHNMLNITAAAAGLHDLTRLETFRLALNEFEGVYRRFQWVVKTGSQVLIDDYAHHPQEILYTVQTVKELYPQASITGIFQPHLYSRTQDFAAEFARALKGLDRVILLPIYPAREEPIPGVSSKLIYQHLKHEDKRLLNKSELIAFAKKDNYDVILTLGAGDIADIVPEIASIIKAKN